MKHYDTLAVDLRAMFAAIPAQATALAIAAAWRPIVGSMPAVTAGDGFWSVTFTPEQEDLAAAWLLTQLNKEPGPVRVNMSGISTKVLTRQYWPWVLAVAATGAALGYMVRGR